MRTMRTSARLLVAVLTLFWVSAACAQGGSPSANLALRRAALEGQVPAVKAALGKKADANGANADGVTPLMLASAKGHREVVSLLLSSGARVDDVTTRDKVSALMFAAYYGHTPVVDALLNKGAKTDLVDGGKRNVIDWAGMHDSVGVPEAKALVAHLKEKGAQAQQTNALGSFLSVGTRPSLDKLLEAVAGEK